MKAYLEYRDIALMESVAQSPQDTLLIRLLPRLGCRISELLAIKVKDLDLSKIS